MQNNEWASSRTEALLMTSNSASALDHTKNADALRISKEKAYNSVLLLFMIAASGACWFGAISIGMHMERSEDDAKSYLNKYSCTDEDGNGYEEHCGTPSSLYSSGEKDTCNEVKYVNGNTSLVNQGCSDQCETACEGFPKEQEVCMIVLTFLGLIGTASVILFIFNAIEKQTLPTRPSFTLPNRRFPLISSFFQDNATTQDNTSTTVVSSLHDAGSYNATNNSETIMPPKIQTISL